MKVREFRKMEDFRENEREMNGRVDLTFEERKINNLLLDTGYGMHKCRYKLPKNHPYVLLSLAIILATVIILAVFGNTMHKALLLICTAVPIVALFSMFFHIAGVPQKNIRNAMLYIDLVVERKRLGRKKKLLARYSQNRDSMCFEDFQMRYLSQGMGDANSVMNKKYIDEMIQTIDSLIEEF